MKIRISLFLILAFPVFLYAQEIKKGTEFVHEKKYRVKEIIGADESGYYVSQISPKGLNVVYSLSKLDPTLKLMKTTALTPVFNKEELSFDNLIFANGKLHLFASSINKKSGKKILYHQTVDKNTFALNNDQKQIAEVAFQGYFKGGNIIVDKSNDNSKILVSAYPPNDDSKPKTVEFMLYDQDMNLQWKNSVTFPKNLAPMATNLKYLTNKGAIVITPAVLTTNLPGIDVTNKTQDGLQKVIVITKEGITGEYDLDMGNLISKKLQFTMADNGNIVCAGLYSKDPKNHDKADGICYFNIDPSTKKVIKTTKEFTSEFITKYLTKKKAEDVTKKEDKGKDVGIYKFDFAMLKIRKDGGAYYMAEQYDVDVDKVGQNVANSSAPQVATYYHRDILVANFNPNGEVEWMEFIPKLQRSFDTKDYSSYVPCLFNDDIYFLFNDHAENQNLWKTGKLKNFTSKDAGCITMVRLGKDARQERTVLDKTKAPLFIIPFYNKQMNENELIFYSGKDDKNWFSSIRTK